MNRQLYYLLPDIEHTHSVYEDLKQMNISEDHIHVVTKEPNQIRGIHDVHSLKEKDRDYFLENFLWRLNLVVFGIAVMVIIGMAIWQISYYLLIPLSIIGVTFLLGLYFALRVPHVHWNEFFNALNHGETLLIVDVPKSELPQVDHVIHRRHPEAINGGVCWKV